MAIPAELSVARAVDIIRQAGSTPDDPLTAAPDGRVVFVQNPTGRKATAVIEMVVTYSGDGIVVVPLSVNGVVNLATELLAALKRDGGELSDGETLT